MSSFDEQIAEFRTHLKLERSLSEHSISAYTRDISKFCEYLEINQLVVGPVDINQAHLTFAGEDNFRSEIIFQIPPAGRYHPVRPYSTA